MKLVKEYINEKFEEDCDPISDMDIGVLHLIKNLDKKIEEKARSIKPNEYESADREKGWQINNSSHGTILRGLEIIPEFGIIKILFFTNRFRYSKTKELIDKVKNAIELLEYAGIINMVELPPDIKKQGVGRVTKHTCSEVVFKVNPEFAKYLPTVDDQY